MTELKKKETARRQRRVVGVVVIALGVGVSSMAGAAETGSSSRLPEGHPPMGKPSTSQTPAKLVDINSASRAELKTLPGIGDAEAEKIIKGRPYLSKADLVTKNVLTEGAYAGLRKQIIARQPSNKPAARK